ncbi:hypothetical protein IJH23_00325 [Candidatus Saccharibacteria bacterium]|nr:hypothetical protein [Candidatus Saccharibacteria bacterium]
MEYNEKDLKKLLKTDAKALGIPSGAAEIFIERTLKSIEKSLKSKDLITESDLTRLVVRELKKYHADLAYVYQNRDKIV